MFTKHFRNAAVTACLLAGVALPQVHAAIPQQISNQGYITDKVTGVPLNGVKQVTFKLYVPEQSDAIWEETLDVAFQDGLYTVQVGTENPISVGTFNGKELSLGITLDGEKEFEPRLTFNSVPYAMSAQTALNVTGPITPHSITIDSNVVIDDKGTVRPESVVFGSREVIDSAGLIDAANIVFKNEDGEITDTFINEDGTLAVVGAQGPQGEKGEKGDTGAQGLVGPQGLPGTNGVNGKDGLNGENGLNGKDGLNGLNGKDGVDGKSISNIELIDLDGDGYVLDFTLDGSEGADFTVDFPELPQGEIGPMGPEGASITDVGLIG